MSEKTLILFKPDAVMRQLTGKILQKYEEKGLQIAAMKMLKVSREQAEKHYIEHREKPFFQDLVAYITESPIIAMVLKGVNAVKIARTLNGATDGSEAAPGTIRGDFAMSKRFNLVHASDSNESAERETRIYFSEFELFDYNLPAKKWF